MTVGYRKPPFTECSIQRQNGSISARREPIKGGPRRQFNVGPRLAYFCRSFAGAKGRSHVGSAQRTDMCAPIRFIASLANEAVHRTSPNTTYRERPVPSAPNRCSATVRHSYLAKAVVRVLIPQRIGHGEGRTMIFVARDFCNLTAVASEAEWHHALFV